MIGLSGLECYLSQIRRWPVLTAQQEQDLARRVIHANDGAAREEMIVCNLRLVVSLAKRYSNRGLAMVDLVAEGNLGLLRAVEGFNPEMNIRFSTYATWWIKQAMRRALLSAVRPVRIPAYMTEAIVKCRQAMGELEQRLGRAATAAELGAHLNLSAKHVRRIHRAEVVARSQPTLAGDDDGASLADLLCDERTRSPEEIVHREDEIRTIRRLLHRIDGREAEILRLRFALDGGEPLTLDEIGMRLGLTRERVRQIQHAALGTLNTYLCADRLPCWEGVGEGDAEPEAAGVY